MYQHLVTIHLRHNQVEQYQVEFVFLNHLQRLAPVLRLCDGMTLAFKVMGQ